jgi:hypothetical protein
MLKIKFIRNILRASLSIAIIYNVFHCLSIVNEFQLTLHKQLIPFPESIKRT